MTIFDELKGQKVALCDVIYQGPSKKTDWHDYITFVYKNTDTGKKSCMNIQDPEYDIYEVKPEHRTFRKTRHYIELEKTTRHRVKYKDRYREIAKIAGDNSEEMAFYKENFKSRRKLDQLYKYPYVLGADVPLETYYRVIWDKVIGAADGFIPSTVYLDIEVDQKEWTGRGIAKHGECPINAICITDDETNTVYQFLYKTPDNPLIDDFINNRQEEFQRVCHESFDKSYGNGKPMTYNIYMLDDELELIKQAWKLIHHLKRDFMMIWNAPYDTVYMEDRMVILGADPETIMCHSDFASTVIYFRLDEEVYEHALKRDYYDISMYTRIINQLSLYPSLRRSKGAIRRLNLGAVAWNELKDTKLDYTDVGNIITLPHEDYFRFALYNIKDTLLQMGINRKCRDMTTYYNSCYFSYCGYKDGLKQTMSLRSLFYHELLEDGYIIGNNANFDNYDPNEKKNKKKKGFSGAINGDSMLNEFEGLEVFGKKSMFYFGNCIDFDFSSMYPNIMIVFNIFAVCMIGKLMIENDERFKRYDKDGGKEFIEDLIAENVHHLGQKWLGLPSFTALNDMIMKRLKVA
ncbi:MAG: hypothetical protein NC548_38905 [Lachnospiraceae bacterium]|nr:hypothetical protein [Lachnospiraceae bacterium]